MTFKVLSEAETTQFLETPGLMDTFGQIVFEQVRELGHKARADKITISIDDLVDILFVKLGNKAQSLLPDASFQSIAHIASFLSFSYAEQVQKAAIIQREEIKAQTEEAKAQPDSSTNVIDPLG
jgi:hypothetical protein